MTEIAQRTHEQLEEKLRELMAQDEKTRAKHDKVAAELDATSEELTRIAAAKLELMTQLGGIYKRYANGTAKRKES
jgi:predicted nuclease with TOPRIM domain